MISIVIGSAERKREDASPDWINQQINRRRRDELAVCVRVRVHCPGIRLALSTPACTRVSGGRPPSAEERRIIDLWNARGLNRDDFTGGNLIAFLRQLDNIVGICT